MITSETGVWNHVKKWWKPLGKFTRIETGLTAVGVPDVDAYVKGYGSIKIELKFCKKFAKGFELRPAQHRFMQDRIKVGDQDIWIYAIIDDPTVCWGVTHILIHSSHSKNLIENKTCPNWLRHAAWKFEGDLTGNAIKSMMEVITHAKDG